MNCKRKESMTRLAIRGYIRGVKQFEERIYCPDDAQGLDKIAEEHARRLLALPGGDRHMIEIEFLDDPDPSQRFFRFGTDQTGMVAPIAFTPPS
jgi:hypothetical protein